MKNLSIVFVCLLCESLMGAIPPPIQSTQLTTNVPKPAVVQSVFVITNATSGMGEWVLLSSTSGSATNALSVIQKNGTVVASGVTNLDFVDGTNVSISITNSPAGSVHFSANLNPLVTVNASNLSYAIGTAATNYTDSRSVNASNLSYSIGTDSTNYANSRAVNLTNQANANSVSASNLSYAIGTASTNYTDSRSVNLTNQANANSVAASNLSYAIGASATNALNGKVDNLNGLATNLTIRTPNGGPGTVALTVNTNRLVVDNGFVGIGTNHPQSRLHIIGAGITTNILQLGTTANDNQFFVDTNGGVFAYNGFRLSTNSGFQDQEWVTENRLQAALLSVEGTTYFLQTNAHPVVSGALATRLDRQTTDQFLTNVLAAGSNQIAIWLSTNFVTSGVIPAGLYDLHIHARKTAGGSDVILGVDLVRTNGSGITTLVNGDTNAIPSTVETDFNLSMRLGASVVVSATDYIGVRLYAIRGGGGVNAITHVGGVTDSHFNTPNLSGGGVTTTISIQTNGVAALSTANTINFVGGTNTQVLATNMGGGTVNVAVHATGSSSSGSVSVFTNGVSVVTTATNLNFVNMPRATNSSGNVSIDITPQHSTLTYAGTVTLDFNGDTYKTVTLTGDIIFQTSNLSAPKALAIRVVGDGSVRTLTFPATWKFLGSGVPAAINISKTGILSVTSFGTTDADVVAVWGVQP